MMTIIPAVILTVIFLSLSGLHIYWAMGGRWESDKAIPTRVRENGDEQLTFRPPPLATLLVALGLFVAALLVLLQAGLVPLFLPAWMPQTGVWALVVVFALRSVGEFRYVGLFKRVRTTTFARMDTRYYTPLCIVISLLALVLTFS